MKSILISRTGLLPLDKAIDAAKKLNESDDWRYEVIDCKNGFGRIDVFDEDNEIVISGFIL